MTITIKWEDGHSVDFHLDDSHLEKRLKYASPLDLARQLQRADDAIYAHCMDKRWRGDASPIEPMFRDLMFIAGELARKLYAQPAGT